MPDQAQPTNPSMLKGKNLPVIMLLSEDLFITPILEDAASRLGCEVLVLDQDDILQGEQPVRRSIPLTEPLVGSEARLIRWLSKTRPALILIDLNAPSLPWARWIQTIKTSAATRRIPIVAFDQHIQKKALKLARSMGADEVITRGRLFASLQKILTHWIAAPDQLALDTACRGELSSLGKEGLSLIEAREFFEAHEVLEQAWLQAGEFEGYLYRGLLQVAVAYLHITRSNFVGAAKMLLRMRQWLDPLPDACCGVDIVQLRGHMEQLRTAIDDIISGQATGMTLSSLQPIPLLHQTKNL